MTLLVQQSATRSKDDGSLDIQIKKAVLASLAEQYEAMITTAGDGKVRTYGTMTAILSTPTVQKLGIKRHVLQYEIDKRKKKKQDEATAATDGIPLPTTTNDADDDNTTDPQMMPPIDPPTPNDYSQTTVKKVGRPSHADKAVQAEAKANLQNTITAAADAFAHLKAQAQTGGKKQVPTGALDRCIEEAKLTNNVPASVNISKKTVYSRVSRGNHTGSKVP
jgi:hypothetical protein